MLESGLGRGPVEEGDGGDRALGSSERGNGGRRLSGGNGDLIESFERAVAIFEGVGDERAEIGEREVGGDILGEMAGKQKTWDS